MNNLVTPIGMEVEKLDRCLLSQNQFPFYLEAWAYCRKNNIEYAKIQRKNWNIWEVELTEDK